MWDLRPDFLLLWNRNSIRAHFQRQQSTMNISFHKCITYSGKASDHGGYSDQHCTFPSWVFPPSIHPSVSLFCFISSARLPRVYPVFLSPLQPLPSQLLRLIHHLSPFFFRSTCVFSRAGEREEDGLRRLARYWLSFVFLICLISVWCWEEGRGGDAKTMR